MGNVTEYVICLPRLNVIVLFTSIIDKRDYFWFDIRARAYKA